MKLVMTVVARDEADVLDAQLAYHLSAGVDYVIATDHRSTDATAAIFERYGRAGRLLLIREDADEFRPSAWVTRMARLAATELGADWVINSDADEFWWPRGGSLKDVLARVPLRFGVLAAPIRHFFLRPDDGWLFSERMVVRPLLTAAVNDPRNPLRQNTHMLHRADPRAVVTTGNHHLRGTSLALLSSWHPVEVLHFPLRSLEQARRRHSLPARVSTNYRAFEAADRGELDVFLGAAVLGDDVLERGLAEGSLVLDTRVRDALRALAGVAPVPVTSPDRGGARFPLPVADGSGLAFPRPSPREEAAYAAETAAVEEAQHVRLQRRVDELEERVSSLMRSRRRVLRGRRGAETAA